MDKRQETTFGNNPVTLLGTKVNVGDKAQDFTCLNAELKPVKLSDYDGKKKLISVVPSIDTGVCEFQTKEFNKKASEFDNTIIFTISCDLPFAQSRFCAAEGIDNLIVLSDHKDLDFGLKYGFVMEEFRLLNRGIVILDENNEVKYVEYVKENTNHPDYDKAIEALKSL